MASSEQPYHKTSNFGQYEQQLQKTYSCIRCKSLEKPYKRKAFKQNNNVFLLHLDYTAICLGKRSVERKMQLEKIVKVCSALRNSNGGQILVHIDGQHPQDRCLEYFDEFVTRSLSDLIEDGQIYVKAYHRRWLSELEEFKDATDFLLLTVEAGAGIATVDFNTRLNNDVEMYRPQYLSLAQILFNQTCERGEHPEGPILRGLPDDVHKLHENRSIQLKSYRPKPEKLNEFRNNASSFVDYIWNDLRLKEYLTSMSKVPGGGSYFLGISEVRMMTSGYTTKKPRIEGFPVPSVDELRKCIMDKIKHSVTVLVGGTFSEAPADLFKVEFYPLHHDQYILEVAVGYFDGIVFFDKTGPSSYIIHDQKIFRMTKEEWFQRFENHFKMCMSIQSNVSRAYDSNPEAVTSWAIEDSYSITGDSAVYSDIEDDEEESDTESEGETLERQGQIRLVASNHDYEKEMYNWCIKEREFLAANFQSVGCDLVSIEKGSIIIKFTLPECTDPDYIQGLLKIVPKDFNGEIIINLQPERSETYQITVHNGNNYQHCTLLDDSRKGKPNVTEICDVFEEMLYGSMVLHYPRKDLGEGLRNQLHAMKKISVIDFEVSKEVSFEKELKVSLHKPMPLEDCMKSLKLLKTNLDWIIEGNNVKVEYIASDRCEGNEKDQLQDNCRIGKKNPEDQSERLEEQKVVKIPESASLDESETRNEASYGKRSTLDLTPSQFIPGATGGNDLLKIPLKNLPGSRTSFTDGQHEMNKERVNTEYCHVTDVL